MKHLNLIFVLLMSLVCLLMTACTSDEGEQETLMGASNYDYGYDQEYSEYSDYSEYTEYPDGSEGTDGGSLYQDNVNGYGSSTGDDGSVTVWTNDGTYLTYTPEGGTSGTIGGSGY